MFSISAGGTTEHSRASNVTAYPDIALSCFPARKQREITQSELTLQARERHGLHGHMGLLANLPRAREPGYRRVGYLVNGGSTEVPSSRTASSAKGSRPNTVSIVGAICVVSTGVLTVPPCSPGADTRIGTFVSS